MSQTYTPTTDPKWPKLASNANTHSGKKHSLPVHAFGSVTGQYRDANTCYSSEADPFQAGDPGGLAAATPKMQDKDRLGKSLNGFDESKLASPIRSSSARSSTLPITDARQPRGRPPSSSATLPALIDTRSLLSYRDAAVKCTPPPSPLVASSQLPPIPTTTMTSKPATTTNTSAWLPSPATPQRPKLNTDTKQFPPLLSPAPITTTSTSTTKPSTASSSSRSYAKCFDPSAPVPESPANATGPAPNPTTAPPTTPSARSPSQAKVITLCISPSKHAVNNASLLPSVRSPTTPNKPPRKKSSAPTPTSLGNLRPVEQRARSASVSSSISSTPSVVSTVATSVATTPRPGWESEEWYAELVTFARGMSKKGRFAWEKILRCNPKDTSKMKWADFDMALKAVGFESKTRGGSDLEYTPGRFGDNVCFFPFLSH
ncbi:hypothetical protein FRC12_019307 [Ceratobasidium sp. 428]|nr:hypothetical protein FRC12_019307 [Ceratobasidium sp. 428]